MTKLRSLAVLTMLYAPVLAGQTAANWTEQNPKNSPPARLAYGVAYDSAHGRAVLFGGYGGPLGALNDTWAWDGADWSQESLRTTPPARIGPAMAYDSAHGQVVLFGGADSPGGDVTHAGVFNDTWVWDGSNWTQKVPQTSPTPRSNQAMAYDSVHGQVVLFGGVTASGSAFADTWVWDGSNWTQSSQSGPTARYASVVAYDSAHSRIVLFGGKDASGNLFNDTWLWDGAKWTQASPQTSPPARYDHAVAYDSALGQVVLFGGYGNTNALNDTWVWDGSNWTQESPQTSPPARYGDAMAYDSAHGQVVLFGGVNNSLLNDTWTYAVSALPPAGPSISGVVSASAFGGFSSVAPGSWVEIYGSNLGPDTEGWTSAEFNGNNAPTSLHGVSVSIGGQAAFVDYISATQVNAQLPSNIATGGTLQLAVTNANGTSMPVNITVNTAEPGLLAPASFKLGANQYVVAQLPDGTYVLPTGAIAGVNSRPAKPGETIVIYGVGFGSVTPNIPAGEIATEANQLAESFEILFGKTSAHLTYFGLAPSFVGLYQFNVVVPAVANSDLAPLTFNLAGAAGTQTLFTAVQQ